jgi:peroxiredoxin
MASVLLLLFLMSSLNQRSAAKPYHNKSSHAGSSSILAAGDTLRKFPAFTYPDTSGRRYSLADLKGNKRTLVIFWASWCAPCRKEIPALKQLYSKYKQRGFSMISISVDQKITAWKRAVKEENMPWPNIANLPDDDHAIMEHFGITSVPSLFLLDSAGSVLLSDPGLQQVEDHLRSNL